MQGILITGTTGFLGGALAAHLLETRNDVGLIAPARATRAASARARVEASLRRFSMAPPIDRVHAIEADLAQPEAIPRLPFEGVSHVVHLAVATGSGTRAFNVDGTLALARAALESGALERFLYVSSAWTCGAGAPSIIRAEHHLVARPLFAYLADKLMAEQLLEEVPGLPLQIVRPSLVMGHTSRGCEPSASLFWLLRLIDEVQCVPWQYDQRLDVVPVDWLASAMEHVLLTESTKVPRRLHLSAGAASPCWRDLEQVFARVRGGAHTWSYEPMPLASWFDLAVRALGAAAPPRDVIERCIRFVAGASVFDNSAARGIGVPAPPPLTAYLDICLARDGGRSIGNQALDDV